MEYMYNLLQSIDLFFLEALHGLSGVSVLVDTTIIFFGHYVPYVVLLFVLYFMYRATQRKAGSASDWHVYVVAILSGLVARYGVAEAIRFFYHRPRPFLALDLPHLLTETSYSFPSGHAIFFFALAAGIYTSNKRLGAGLFVAAVLIGLGRVAAGVHYPSDILGGALLGILVGWGSVKIFLKQ